MDEECGWGDSTKEALDHIQQQIKNQLPHREGEKEGDYLGCEDLFLPNLSRDH